MEIVPITEMYWSEALGEMVDTGAVIGYQALGSCAVVVATGETIADAIEAALQAIWLT